MLLELIAEIAAGFVDEDRSDHLQGEGMQIISPSNIFDFRTRLKALLGLKRSSHTDTLTETINLVEQIYKKDTKRTTLTKCSR